MPSNEATHARDSHEMIEPRLGPEELKRYRRWKRSVRATAANLRADLAQMAGEGSLRRAFDQDFRPLFICGAASSGTTLLSGLLDQHYENALSLRESARHPLADRLLFVEKAYEYESLESYEAALRQPEGASTGRVRRAVLRLYRRAVHYPKASHVVLDKAPNAHLVRMKALRGAFPDSLAVVIFRDPLAVIEGLRRKWPHPFGTASLEALCDFWNDMHRLAMDDLKGQDEQALFISYEHLVEQAEALTAILAEWAGMEKRAEALSLVDRRNKPGKGLRNVVEGEIQIVKNTSEQARKNLSQAEQRKIRELTGPVYAQLEARQVRVA
ncbi:MAG: sulfotransferase [Chloroflexi bacterium]|nr:sulfotransferase [Chloroflexota bacterium]